MWSFKCSYVIYYSLMFNQKNESTQSLIFLPLTYVWVLWVWWDITTTPPWLPPQPCWLVARLLTDPSHPVGGMSQLSLCRPRAPPLDPCFSSMFQEAYEKLVHHMCSGPSRLLILTRTEGTEDVVTAWRTLMGPCDPNVARMKQPDR